MITEQRTKTYSGPNGIRLVLDLDEVCLDNPGDGTPAMVYQPFNRDSASLWCLLGSGEFLDGYVLTKRAYRWLESLEDEVNAFLYASGGIGPESSPRLML